MYAATPLHKRNSLFKCKQHTCTIDDFRGPAKYNYTIMYIVVLKTRLDTKDFSINYFV